MIAAPAFRTEVLVRSEETAGRLGLVRNTVPAGWDGPPLHHHDFDEAFYVLGGRLTFQLGDGLATAGPGALAFAPAGAPHTLANLSDADASYLLVCTPGGFERYFDRIAAAQAGVEPPATAAAGYPETIVVGPQIGDRDDIGAAPALPVAEGGVNVLVHAEQSDGRLGLMDNLVPAGARGPALHRHAFDELFVMLEGELTFRLGDDLLPRRAGETAFVPGGMPHAFANRSGAPARFLIACTPAGFERYFARIAAERAGTEPPAWALQPTPEVARVGPQI